MRLGNTWLGNTYAYQLQWPISKFKEENDNINLPCILSFSVVSSDSALHYPH